MKDVPYSKFYHLKINDGAGNMKPVVRVRDGTEIEGIDGLRNYISGPRREDFLRSLAQKLTGYALGRAVMTSDRQLIAEVVAIMNTGGSWSEALLAIAQSEQFRCIRPTSDADSNK